MNCTSLEKIAIPSSLISINSYTLDSAGFDISLTAEQIKAADVNEDGQLDARDASIILTYYGHL
mgnify:CR=1 FL=1